VVELIERQVLVVFKVIYHLVDTFLMFLQERSASTINFTNATRNSGVRDIVLSKVLQGRILCHIHLLLVEVSILEGVKSILQQLLHLLVVRGVFDISDAMDLLID
jgi:hypothetical protein